MDILDILIAKNQSFTGETAKLTQQAKAAMAKANEVATKIDEAEEALAAAQEAQTAAESANNLAQEIAADLDNMKEEVTAAAEEVVDEKMATVIENLQSAIDEAVTDVTVEDDNSSSYKKKTIKVRKKGVDKAYELIKNYTTTGSNEDGTMTQKAITTALANIHSSGSGENLGPENQGNMVVIGENGEPTSSNVTEQELLDLLNKSSEYIDGTAVGLTIDYVNKTFTRTENAKNSTAGSDFNKFLMYGGRMRCNVADDGTINAFYGDPTYTDDGSNGQVMVYQPKFYYQIKTTQSKNISMGTAVQNHTILLSAEPLTGFKIHPLFVAQNGDILDYVLISAYEGSCYHTTSNAYFTADEEGVDFNNDKLSSIANVKPISGQKNNLTMISAEQLAANRGTGWHITNLAAESALQMLYAVEYGSLNSQQTLGLGISNLTSTTINSSSHTGSTSSLGNTSGHAPITTNITNGQTITYSTNGTVAISYRGMENPWGNIWRFVGGVLINGSTSNNRNWIYIANSYNYTDSINDYTSCSFPLVNTSNWLSSFGLNTDSTYDWVLMPAEASGGNSALPIGDFVWTSGHLTTPNSVSIGGNNSHGDNNGIFYYACDRELTGHSYAQSARIMYIPDKSNNNYSTNYSNWTAHL